MVSDINAKDDENSVFEKEKCELEHNITNQEEHIKKKIKLLQMHLEEKKEYGTKLQKRHFCIKK